MLGTWKPGVPPWLADEVMQCICRKEFRSEFVVERWPLVQCLMSYARMFSKKSTSSSYSAGGLG